MKYRRSLLFFPTTFVNLILLLSITSYVSAAATTSSTRTPDGTALHLFQWPQISSVQSVVKDSNHHGPRTNFDHAWIRITRLYQQNGWHSSLVNTYDNPEPLLLTQSDAATSIRTGNLTQLTGTSHVNEVDRRQTTEMFWTLFATITAESTYARAAPSLSATKMASLFLGEKYTAIGQNSDAKWLQIRIRGHASPLWIFHSVAQLSGSQKLLAIASDTPLVAVSTNTPTQATTVPESPIVKTPIQTTRPKSEHVEFELGGQVADFRFPDLMRQAGMTWVKRQARWHPNQAASDHFDTIRDAHNKGFKILLSVLGHSEEARSDNFADYARFVGELAATGADAIEVWNEMNLPREWASGSISPDSYTNLLRQSYTSIKSANPDTIVVSGAPAPTGYFSGCHPHGCDDAAFISGMVTAGALEYLDCIGIHYNEGLVPPQERYGDPRGASSHYTRYYQGMVDTYYAAVTGQKPLCFTELGYLSGEEWGTLPKAFLWSPPYNLTIEQHANMLGDAVRLSKQQGKVRLLIIFNVDFTHWSDDPQAGYAMVRLGGNCPACVTVGTEMSKR